MNMHQKRSSINLPQIGYTSIIADDASLIWRLIAVDPAELLRVTPSGGRRRGRGAYSGDSLRLGTFDG